MQSHPAHKEKDAERTHAWVGLTRFCVLMNYVTVRPQWFSALHFCLMNEGKTDDSDKDHERKDIFNGRKLIHDKAQRTTDELLSTSEFD